MSKSVGLVQMAELRISLDLTFSGVVVFFLTFARDSTTKPNIAPSAGNSVSKNNWSIQPTIYYILDIDR